MDEIDWKILTILQAEANLPNTELADRVGLTPAPCLRRVKALQESGVIQGYSLVLDRQQLGLNLSALAEITLLEHTPKAARNFIRAIEGKREVIACHMVTGDCDFILRILSQDVDSYRKLIWEDLHAIEGVLKIRSTMILETFKDQLTPVPLAPSPREAAPGMRSKKRPSRR